jgi:PAS domain S-box-containing protein
VHRSLQLRLLGWFLLVAALVGLALFGGYRNLRATVEADLEGDIEQRTTQVRRDLVAAHALYLERVHTAMRVLQDVTEQLGSANIAPGDATDRVGEREVPVLRFGLTPVANDFTAVDRVTSLVGGTATLFVRSGDDFVRVSTNVLRPGGGRAVGTILDPSGPAIAAIRRGEAYYGVVDILGRPYLTGYAPATDASGRTVGILYVGYLIEDLDRIGEQLADASLLGGGFFALVDRDGRPLFHTRGADLDLIRAAAVRSATARAWEDDSGWAWRAEAFPLWRFTLLAAHRPDAIHRETWKRVLPVFGFMVPLIVAALALGYILAGRLSRALAEAERLQAEARRLALVAAHTYNGVIITDTHGKITWVNPSFTRLTGYTLAEAVGRHPDEFLLGPDTDPVLLEAKRKARAEKKPFQLELLNYRKDGSPLWFLLDGQPILDAEGDVESYIVVQVDITKRKQDEAALLLAREAAEEANRTKSAFLANMSHELRTPMNAIIGYSEMLIEDAEDSGNDDAIPDLKKIHSAGKHLLGLINDVLDISKIEAGKMTLFLEDAPLPALLDEVASTIRPLVAKNNNTLVLEPAPDLGVLHADVTKVRQTLFNLLSNAAKFTHEGRVTLTVTRAPGPDGRDFVHFRVADTGIGMTKEQLGKLFQAFVQADASTTRKYGGTGLGLAISKKFCQLMGGDIAVESEPGKGTVFTASIPARVEDPARSRPPFGGAPSPASAPASASVPSAASPDTTGAGPLILAVDDDPAVLELLTRNLHREGYSVRTATNGRDALNLAKELRPRLITLDVMMPSMDGWSVLTALKADPATRDIPVVMVSIIEDRQLGFTLGAADYITKPVDRARLADILARQVPHDTRRLALVVDDLRDNRAMLRATLEREGWEVVEAEDGQLALDAFSKHQPALILLDLMMPVMDGFEFLRALRAREDGRTVPVVVVTAKELTDDERNYLRACVENIVQKGPLAHDALLTEIRARLG